MQTSLIPAGATAFPGEIRQLGAFPARRINLNDGVKVHHLPTWKHKDDPTRIEALREVSMKAGRDPRLASLAVAIVRGDATAWGRKLPEAKPRDTKAQAARLLKWVQGLYYVNEPGERLQDPLYTVQVGYGDCDDLAMLLGAILESLRIPWRFVLSGRASDGKTIRWIEGQPRKRAQWAHIYVAIGNRPFKPTKWMFAEPTVRGVPLGWDVVSSTQKHGKVVLPELAGFDLGADAKLVIKSIGADKPFVRHVYDEIADALKPRNLVPTILKGLIIGLIADQARRAIERRG
jgi:hypothetical protein